MNKRKVIPERKIVKGEFSLNDYFGKDVFKKAVELHAQVNRPIFKTSAAGISSRNLNWWTTENAVELFAKELNQFNFIELVWVKVIEQLRIFSVSLPLIAIYRKRLFQTIEIEGLPKTKGRIKSYLDTVNLSRYQKNKLEGIKQTDNKIKKTNTGVNPLTLLVMDAILNRRPLAVAFFDDGSLIFINTDKEANKEHKEKLEVGSYMRVSVSKILSEYLVSDLGINTMPDLQLLTHPENKLFEAIKTGDYESISVHFKDKREQPLEFKKTSSAKKKIFEVLSEGKFAEIIIKKHKGDISKIEQNSKTIF